MFSWVQKILWVPKLFQTQYQLYINPSYIDPILTLYRPYIDSIPAQSAVLATSAEPAAPFVPFFLSLFWTWKKWNYFPWTVTKIEANYCSNTIWNFSVVLRKGGIPRIYAILVSVLVEMWDFERSCRFVSSFHNL